MTLTTLGNADSPYIVVCPPPRFGYNDRNPTSTQTLTMFIEEAKSVGFKSTDFFFIQLCEPIPENIKKSDSKTWAYVSEQISFLQGYLQGNEKPVITLGDLATRAAMGKKHAITKVRGTLLPGKVFPMLSPDHCARVLENLPIFKADFITLKKLADNDFNVEAMSGDRNSYYCHDLQFLIDTKPKVISVDTETTGLRHTDPDFEVLTVQIGYGDNNCAVVPLHENFWPGINDADLIKVLDQLEVLLTDPSIKKVGHNMNYDHGAIETGLGIIVRGWLADTQLLAATIDENMYSKSLDDCVRRFVPDEAGYNDLMNSRIDKSNMLLCHPEDMLVYGGGDGRVTLKLFWVLWEMLKQDPGQYNLFLKLKMPGILAFQKMEREGITIDLPYLEQIKGEAGIEVEALHKRLIEAAPKAVLRKHLDGWKDKKKSALRLSRDALVRDILFTKDGFNLTPLVFTDGTKDDPDYSKRIPSVSSKQHLPFFSDLDGAAGEYIEGLIEYAKLEKLNSTYIQNFEEKYVHTDGKIHPSFLLHRTNTGRSSSANPNAQNFPARGKWSKKYKKIFKAKKGYKFISADLSQIELRLVAWESLDPVMLHAYKNDMDIHKITAMAVSGHTQETWDKLSKDEQKLLRYRAKAVNFGFIYGMRAKKFQRYAKTDYGVDLTQDEADRYYNLYHNTYKGVKRWHQKRMSEAHQYGYVTSLHGFRRNLPSIYSNDKMIVAGAERNGINSPIQGFASDLGVLAIARIARQVDPEIICPIAFIHDDIVLQVKDGHEEEALNMLLWVLNNPPLQEIFGIKSPIPIKAEPDIGTSLGDMHELYDLSADAPQEYHDLAKKINPQKPLWWSDAKDIR